MKKVKVLNLVIVVWMACIVIGCETEKTTPMRRNRLFEFDLSSGKHFRFLYARYPELDTTFTEVIVGEDDSITTKTFLRDQPLTEIRSKLNESDVTLGSFTVFHPDDSGKPERLKGSIKRVSNLEGKYNGSELTVEIIPSFTKKISTNTRNTYSGDTVIVWNGEQLPALKFDMIQTVTTINRIMPLSKDEMQFSGTSYFAKGIGLIGEHSRRIVPDGGNEFYSSSWLIDIQKIE